MSLPFLQKLNDRIISSETQDVMGVIDENDYMCFNERVGNIVNVSNSLSSLEQRRDITLNVLDFDDTIYSRYHQLQEPIMQDNRGASGNIAIKDTIGYENFLERFYKKSEAVQRLIGILEEQNDKHKAMILTAGINEWQNRKCSSVGIDKRKVPIHVVERSKDKPYRLLQHIIHDLRFIPGKIIVYEDRPEHFIATAKVFAKILGSEIVINKVDLSERNSKKQISKIEQIIFIPQGLKVLK